MYRVFESIGGIVHSHSTWATSFAQVGREIILLRITHADYFHGVIACIRDMRAEDINGEDPHGVQLLL